MLKYLVYLVFIISVALTAGGIILATRIRSRHKSEFHSSLVYFLTFIYSFGFYGMWGQVLIKAFLTPLMKPEFIQRFSDFSLLIGLPFLVFAWLMLLRFTSEITGRVFGTWKTILFLFINFTTVVFLGWLISEDDSARPVIFIRYFYIIMNLLYTTAASILLYTAGKGRSIIHGYDKRTLSAGLFLTALLICVPLFFYTNFQYAGLIFILFYFTGNTFLPVYLNYGTLVSTAGTGTGNEKVVSIEEFCKKFEISPRETDIIREICNGLSNKEISDKLFISLQTVKDHTHRIYIKTNVRSRVQLINLVKEELIYIS
jgi:DNA-binding CsgD family transcriptional regulator